jgi:hypothetical protein
VFIFNFYFPQHRPSYPSYISKSSSSTGSDENWSTISPDNVIWDRIEFGTNDDEYNTNTSAPTTTTTNQGNMMMTMIPSNDENNATSELDDLLVNDAIGWLIETDCTQEYLPESSLPYFPFNTDKYTTPITSTSDNEIIDTNEYEPNDIADPLLQLHDPNSTDQALFLPTTGATTTTTNMIHDTDDCPEQ